MYLFNFNYALRNQRTSHNFPKIIILIQFEKLYLQLKAIHNKDYSAVKTFKGATHLCVVVFFD